MGSPEQAKLAPQGALTEQTRWRTSPLVLSIQPRATGMREAFLNAPGPERRLDMRGG